MNLKTTLLLLALIAVGGVAWYVVANRTSAEASSETLRYLEKLKADELTKIDVKVGDRSYTLQRSGPKTEWSLPGGWPVRDKDVEELVKRITSLSSRFVPLPAADKSSLKKYGLDADTATVVLTAGKEAHTLTLGEPRQDTNRYSTPTYLRLDNQNEVVRLAPGLIDELDKGEDYFRQRRLFAIERVAKDDGIEKVQQVVAKEIAIKGLDGSVELVKAGDRWEMKEPTRDKVDPDKLQSLLTKLPEVWAEKFINNKLISVKETGLDQPSQVFTITRPNGGSLKLLVGNVSRTDIRKVMKPGPPNQFGMPSEPKVDLIHEQYRYARLENNDQIFEVKGDILKDLTTAPSELRDPQVARFKSADVDRVEIEKGKEIIVLAKKDDRWQVEKPLGLEAETSQVNDLLNKLADLNARDKNVLDKANLKKLGLEDPAVTVKVHVEEKEKDGKKVKKTEDLVFHLAPFVEEKSKKDDKEEKAKDKFYVLVKGWPRVNVVEGEGLKLASRPALAYRSRRVLDALTSDVKKLDVTRGGETFTFENADGGWKMTAPMAVDVDSRKVDSLAGDIAKLDVVDFVTAEPKKEDLEKEYGLAKPDVQVKLTFKDEKKKPQILTVGKAKDDKGEFYARLDDGPVFVVKKSLHDDLDRGSLAYRANQLWDLEPNQIAALTVQKDGEYRLERQGKDWKIVSPFKAEPVADLVREMVDEVGNLKVEKFVAAGAKDLAQYGLDKPYLQVKISQAKPEIKEEKKEEKKDDKTAEKKDEKKVDPPKDRTLVIGKETEKGRFAKLSDGDAVFIVPENLVKAVDRTALDLLEKRLLSLQPRDIQQAKIVGDKIKLTLADDKGVWKVTESPAPAFTAEKDVVQEFLRTAGNLRADKIVAYGDKLDLAAFGLDKPALTITLQGLEPKKDDPKEKVDDKEKAKEKAEEHVIQVSGDVKGKRYVRVDKGPAIAQLSPVAAEDLVKTHLDFVSPLVLELDVAGVDKIVRQEGKNELEIVKSGDNWQVKKPFDKPADTITVEQKVLERLVRLKAEKVAEYPAKDLKSFGLDTPTATVTFKSENGDHIVKLGKAEGDTGARYALVDKGDKVVVLPAELSKSLLMTALNFSDRNLAFLSGADEVTLERGKRQITFKKADGVWKLVEPIKAGAEDADLDALLRDLYRLRADEIVAEKGDLSKYGLDKPAAEWKLTANKKELLHLLVGKAEGDKGEGRYYAKLAKGDLVFLLNPKTSAKVLDEYRSRKVLETFDAAQVDWLTVEGPSPAERFALVKKNGDWIAGGKTDVKLDSKKISETLDALARLKAERFVQDAKADLQIHGLVPPEWTIQIGVGTGKRILQVGRAEGMTKAHYATTPGLDAVFILGSADAEKILRSLKGYE